MALQIVSTHEAGGVGRLEKKKMRQKRRRGRNKTALMTTVQFCLEITLSAW